MIKADADLMLPSDSDDDAPEGGYYVIESGRPEMAEPSPPSPSPESLLALPVVAPISVEASLLPSKPARIPSKPVLETMVPSDSDSDAPFGGYEVRVTDPAEARAAILAKSKAKAASRGHSNGTRTRRRRAPSHREDGTLSTGKNVIEVAP
jgi:hypothetical protein